MSEQKEKKKKGCKVTHGDLGQKGRWGNVSNYVLAFVQFLCNRYLGL